MRLVSIKNCQPGMIAAKPIFTETGKVLIGEGVALTARMISSLKKLNVSLIYIKDKATEDLQIGDSIPFEVRVEAAAAINDTFRELNQGGNSSRNSVRYVRVDQLQRVFKNLLSELKAAPNALNLLTSVYVHDDYTFSHSTNVTLYTLAMAIKLGYSDQKLNEIGMGGMLHDIGKTGIPLEILNKKGPLTAEEFELIKKHPEFGFELLRRDHSISLLSAHCAYQHHEKLDGTGYPRGIKGDDIHPYAKIMAVADVFDALTSNRSYRDAMLPHEAMEILFAGTHTHFEDSIITIFRQTVAVYPEGVTVQLNTGEIAVVISYQFDFPGRPVVRVIADPFGNRVEHPYEIDLAKDLSIMITNCDAVI